MLLISEDDEPVVKRKKSVKKGKAKGMTGRESRRKRLARKTKAMQSSDDESEDGGRPPPGKSDPVRAKDDTVMFRK